jgi:hypothetical protein
MPADSDDLDAGSGFFIEEDEVGKPGRTSPLDPP